MAKKKAMFPEPIKVNIGYGENEESFEIMPLVRKKYKKLFKIIGDIIKDLVADEDTKNSIDLDNITQSIPLLISTAGDKLCEIYSFILSKDVEWIEDNMLPQQEAALITAIFEQNDIDSIVKNFRKMIAILKK